MELYRQLGIELTTGDRTSTGDLLYVASAIPLLYVIWCGSACLSSFGLKLLYSGLSPSPLASVWVLILTAVPREHAKRDGLASCAAHPLSQQTLSLHA